MGWQMSIKQDCIAWAAQQSTINRDRVVLPDRVFWSSFFHQSQVAVSFPFIPSLSDVYMCRVTKMSNNAIVSEYNQQIECVRNIL